MDKHVSCRDKEAHPEVWTTLISRPTSPKSRKRGFLVLAARDGPPTLTKKRDERRKRLQSGKRTESVGAQPTVITVVYGRVGDGGRRIAWNDDNVV